MIGGADIVDAVGADVLGVEAVALLGVGSVAGGGGGAEATHGARSSGCSDDSLSLDSALMVPRTWEPSVVAHSCFGSTLDCKVGAVGADCALEVADGVVLHDKSGRWRVRPRGSEIGDCGGEPKSALLWAIAMRRLQVRVSEKLCNHSLDERQ